jgi:hypothetical protein
VRWLSSAGLGDRGDDAAAAEFVHAADVPGAVGQSGGDAICGATSARFALPPAAREKVAARRARRRRRGGRLPGDRAGDRRLIARLVHGEAPDALAAIALACRGPLIVCPAMDLEMWRSRRRRRT